MEELRARNRELETDNARLQAELALKEGVEAQLQEVLLELAELKRQLFGERSDRLTPEEEVQMAEVAADLQEEAAQESPVSDQVLEDQDEQQFEKGGKPKDDLEGRRPRRRRHPMPEHLERQTAVIEPEGLAPCEQCGKPLQRFGQEVSEELEYVPAKMIVRCTVRPKYACRCGGGGVDVAPLPPRLIPQSKLGLGLAIYLLLARFDDHVAYYTLERIFLERHQVVIPRQQMVQWVQQIAFLLQPLCKLMFERMKHGGYLQVDETPVKVMDPEVKGKCARGYLWFYAVPGGDVYLDFQSTRGRDAPQAQLTGFTGTIQTDGYEVYDSLKKVISDLRRIGCAAHCRRKFRRALRDGDRRAIPFIAQFRRLYRIEAQTKDLTPQERHQVRQREAHSDLETIGTGRPGHQTAVAAQQQPGQGGQLPHQRIQGAHWLSGIRQLSDRQ